MNDVAVKRLPLAKVKALCEKLDAMTHAASLEDGPWDEELLCDVADQTPFLVAWVEMAAVLMKDAVAYAQRSTNDDSFKRLIPKLLAKLEQE